MTGKTKRQAPRSPDSRNKVFAVIAHGMVGNLKTRLAKKDP